MAKGKKRTQAKRKAPNASGSPSSSTKGKKNNHPQDTPNRSGTNSVLIEDTPCIPIDLPCEEIPTTTGTTEAPTAIVPALQEAIVPGSFHNASNFVLNNVIIGNTTADDSILRKVAEHILEGTEHDSSARDPPPRCQDGTRKTLRAMIDAWFEKERKEKKFLWLTGPAGAGKSAIMQTVADAMAGTERLAAAIFLSQPNGRSDGNKIVPTLAYQLAVKNASYRAYLAEQITLDPRVFTKSIRELFRRFIIEPFANKNIYSTGPALCILLDGLDECDSKSDQCTIVELIAQFVLLYPAIPHVWIVASRPEDHLKCKFLERDVAANHWQLYVPIDDDEAREDVKRFLRSGFEEVRRKFLDTTPPDWPTAADFLKITDRASGLFVFASTVIRFLEDPEIADPVSQLEAVTSVIDGVSTPFTENPFAILDALYTRIIASIHPSSKLNAELLIGHLLIRGETLKAPAARFMRPYTLVVVSNFLGLRVNDVYSALCKLHSVIYIPSQIEAHKKHIGFFHASFSDFLKDSRRSGQFAFDLTNLNTKLWECCHRIRLAANQDPMSPFPDPLAIPLPWTPSEGVVHDDLGIPMPFQQLLIYETLSYWTHYLLPTDCSCCADEPFHKYAPEVGFLVAPPERLVLLQSLHWNKIASGYFCDDSLHLRLFVIWILKNWEGRENESEIHGVGKKIPLGKFSLDLIDTGMVTYERNPLLRRITLYYSGVGNLYACLPPFKPVENVLYDVALLQRREPNLGVILLGTAPVECALLAYSIHDMLSFYFFPLKQRP